MTLPAVVDSYLAKVTSRHASKPKFMATVAAVMQPFVDLQNFIASIPHAFDVDYAIGVQLDVVGQWAGVSRYIPTPIPNAWFTWDAERKGITDDETDITIDSDTLTIDADTTSLNRGWDQGYWAGPYDTGSLLSRLDDETFRRLIRAKIKANSWDGTIPSAQTVLDAFFSVDAGTYVFIVDQAFVVNANVFFSWDDASRGWDTGTWYQSGDTISTMAEVDMSVMIGVSGKIPTVVDLEILNQLLIPVKSEAVRLDIAVTTVDEMPIFGFDVDNQYIGGWDNSAWSAAPDYVVANII